MLFRFTICLALLLSGCASIESAELADDKLQSGLAVCKNHGGLGAITEPPGKPREFVIRCKDGVKYVPTFMFFIGHDDKPAAPIYDDFTRRAIQACSTRGGWSFSSRPHGSTGWVAACVDGSRHLVGPVK